MRGLTDEEILGVWTNVTDFTEGWEETIKELLDRIEESRQLSDTIDPSKFDELRDETMRIWDEIEETIELAREGEYSIEDLEHTFRSFGEELAEIENKLLDLEFGSEEPLDYYDEEEEMEY